MLPIFPRTPRALPPGTHEIFSTAALVQVTLCERQGVEGGVHGHNHSITKWFVVFANVSNPPTRAVMVTSSKSPGTRKGNPTTQHMYISKAKLGISRQLTSHAFNFFWGWSVPLLNGYSYWMLLLLVNVGAVCVYKLVWPCHSPILASKTTFYLSTIHIFHCEIIARFTPYTRWKWHRKPLSVTKQCRRRCWHWLILYRIC